MGDIFLREDIANLLKNKRVVFMGDSNVRALYKDALCLLRRSSLIQQGILKAKLESSVFGDRLIFSSEKTMGRDFKEERQGFIEGTSLSFFFLTRVYNSYVEQVIENITYKDSEPDVIIVNSCVWDINRWGPHGVKDYQKNLKLLMSKFRENLSPNCLVIWLTTPPLAQDMKGGFLVRQLEFLKFTLRFHIMEANTFAAKIVTEHSYDVLDLHYHLRNQISQRCEDGIHWLPPAVRYITNLLLTHISLAWGVKLPDRYRSSVISRSLATSSDDDSKEKENAENASKAGENSEHDKEKAKQKPDKKKYHVVRHRI